MDDDAQGPWFLTPDRIIFVWGDSPRRRRRHDTPVPDPDGAAAGSSKRARVAASSEAILGLQEVTGGRRSGDECAICLNDFRADEALRAMPCSHAFHQRCISEWLRRNGVCPLCRHRLPAAPTPEEEDDQDSGGEEDDREDQVDFVVHNAIGPTPVEEAEQDGEEDGEDQVYWVVHNAPTPDEETEQGGGGEDGGEHEEHRMDLEEDKQDGGGEEDGEDEDDWEWEDGGIILDQSS